MNPTPNMSEVESQVAPRDDRWNGMNRSTRRGGVIWVGLALWTAGVVCALWWLLRDHAGDSSQAAWIMHDSNTPKPWTETTRDWFRLAHLNFQRIYPWILFGPYALWLGSRFSLERGRLKRSLPVHLAACALFALGSYAVNNKDKGTVAKVLVINSQRHDLSAVGEEIRTVHVEVSGGDAGSQMRARLAAHLTQGELTNPRPPAIITRTNEFAGLEFTNLFSEIEQALKFKSSQGPAPSLRPLSTVLDLFAYGAIIGVAHSIHFYRRYRERERRALFLESNLAKARLSALQAQLQPHFLFNTLNAIAMLLRRDPRAAEKTLTTLSELLRLALSLSEKQEVTLGEELQFVELYFDIQRTRFGDRLRFEQDIEPAALDCLVPTLLLQPLIENAIRHGFEPIDHGGLVRVTAQRKEGFLAITVEDDGGGLNPQPSNPGRCGIGLSNLKTRLTALHGARQKLDLSPRPEGGALVRIEIPWRPVTAVESETSLAPL